MSMDPGAAARIATGAATGAGTTGTTGAAGSATAAGGASDAEDDADDEEDEEEDSSSSGAATGAETGAAFDVRATCGCKARGGETGEMEVFFPLVGFFAFVAFGTFGDGAAFVAIFFFLFLGFDEEAAARFGDPGGGTLSFGELGEATDERPVVRRALAICFAFFVFFFFGVFPPFPCFARFPDAGTAWYGSGAFRLRRELLPTRFATAPGSGSHDSTLSSSLELPVGVPPPPLSSE